MLDTEIYSDVLKATHPNVTLKATNYRAAHSRLTVSVITVMGVIQGLQMVAAGPRRFQAFRDAIMLEGVLNFDQPTADLAGQISGDLDRVGGPIGRCDPMIAALAIANGLGLATSNTAHYQRIQQLGHPLFLANWRL